VSSAPNTQSKQYWKSIKFWLLLLFFIYSVIGWFGVPYIVKQQTIKSLNDLAGWETKIDSVIFNPYALSLAVIGLEAKDKFGQATIDFDRLFVDVNALKSLSGQITLGEISLSSPIIHASLDQSGKSNFERDFANEEQTETEAKDTPAESSSIKWAIAAINIHNGLINWQDNSLETKADLTISHINLALGEISHKLDQAFTYKLAFNTGVTQQQLHGKLSASPLRVEGELDLASLPLPWLQPYINEHLNIQLDQGQLNLTSEYKIEGTEAGISGQIIASTLVRDFELKEATHDHALAGFQNFSISGIDILLDENPASPSIKVDEIRLIKPHGKLAISETGLSNLDHLSKSTPELEGATVTEKEPDNQQAAESNKSPNIKIGNIIIEEGRFDYTDASLNPVFNTYVDQFSGSIRQLSSDPETQSIVALHGNIDSQGKISVNGTTNPLGSKPSTSLNIQVSNIDLSTASPYSGKFAGYLIDKGKLNLDLKYDIDDVKLEADNNVFIDQFNFGESVDSPDSTSLPLRLAISIMKNLDGEIELSLPISGDLNDPSFSIGDILLTAFTNLITKVVTSPFTVLGSLIEGDSDISTVSFQPLQTNLETQEAEKLLKLAEALKQRPQLKLEVRGQADRTVDRSEKLPTLSEDQLAILAKNRALLIAKVLVEQGGIAKQRVFTLEPKIINSESSERKSAVNAIFSLTSN
jgi:uncharacterized protein involved in outer membrane biogenesis